VISQNTLPSENLRPRAWSARIRSAVPAQARRPLVYGALVAFVWLYYYRPEDFIPGLAYVPMAKITGIFAIVALLFGMLSSGKFKIPRAVQLLWLLLLQMALCIPTAIWRGGAFATVAERFSKSVIVAMLISMAVVTVRELRKLLWVQVSAVSLVVLFSLAVHHTSIDGRLTGVQKSILENPNDLAVNIAISFPIAMVFMLNARGFRKLVWIIALALMPIAVVLTYSRSGLLAFILSLVVCVWEYGIKGKRRSLVAIVLVTLVLGSAASMMSAHYRARVASIVMGNIEGSGDKGSLEARKTLLKKSLYVAATHPLFGIGPGCFILVDKQWLAAHNSYTEMAAEAGFPAIILFLLILREAFKNLASIKRSRLYAEDREVRLFTQALWAGLVAYVLGACFASLEYLLYSYMFVAYTCAMAGIANRGPVTVNHKAVAANEVPAQTTIARPPRVIWSR
jgi:O-antigen ligase